MELAPTLVICATAAGLSVLFGWLGARPWKVITGPRMIPWAMLMLLCTAVAMLSAVHALNLAGISTGRR